MICIFVYSIPIYGQKDTLKADGLYLKHNSPTYRGNVTRVTMEQIRSKDFSGVLFKDSDIERGELALKTKSIDLTYKPLPQYIISEQFYLNDGNPEELSWSTGGTITSQWIHEDGECILFIVCQDNRTIVKKHKIEIDKSFDELPEILFKRIIQRSNAVPPFPIKTITEKDIQKIKKRITFWSPEKAKEAFNAQHVMTYPIKSRKSVYMGKFKHKQDLMMIKWGEHLTVSFLVTKKGQRNIEKYIRDVEEAFWFED